MLSNRGSLVVVSGFSGVGKGTVLGRLMEKYDNYAYSVSATTRAKRVGEQEGVNYFYRTEEEFREMIEKDELLEYAQYVGHYYGTPRAYVEEKRDEGRDVILEIEIQGARRIREKVPDAVLIFIMPPSAQALEERLVGRGTEDRATIDGRLARAAQEAQGIEDYDYIVVNDDVDACAESLHGLIQAQRLRASRNISFIREIQSEVKRFSKE